VAGTSLLALIDDIAATLDDIAILTKIAAKKTSGVLGDDLAVNAEKVAGVAADRELPVVWAVAKGSAVNKLILVPSALVISQLAPAVIIPLLLVGGSYLCYEGFEKVWEKIFHKAPSVADAADAEKKLMELDLPTLEKQKISGAIRTDFVLSAEIVVITLGTVATEVFMTKALVLSAISLIMTIGVYGFVAGIVKIDDLGFFLSRPEKARWQKSFGLFLVKSAPYLMKFLGLAGTIAMFMVGGGIITHNWPAVHHLREEMSAFLQIVLDSGVGLLTGALVLAAVHLYKKVKPVVACF
jgi:uncharacterized protein